MTVLCGFMPDIILNNLANADIEEAQTSLLLSIQQRAKRTDKFMKNLEFELTTRAGVTKPQEGIAARECYDCLEQQKQRVKLVRSEGDPATGDDAVKNVYEFCGTVCELYKDIINRNSIDNFGMNLIANVHYGKKYMNAFWDGDEITFGDGDGNIFGSFVNSLEVVAHELGHGVVQYTANLEYWSQSGALNEHFADVFGTVVTQQHEKQVAEDADWLVGDEIMGPKLYGEALRSMKAPGTAYDNDLMGKDPQPDHMRNYYAGSSDNQGVHINSGIPNKAFYLVSMDIGTDKAALIWYHALQNLFPKAKFNDAVKQITKSAQILTKNGVVPAGSAQSVRAGFRDVGLPE